MISRKKLILFDVDDTLAHSKCELSDDMAQILSNVMEHVHIGIISGGKKDVLFKNVVDKISLYSKNNLHKFHVLPTCGARYFAYSNNEWKEIYAHLIEESERKRIMQILLEQAEGEYEKKELYGDIVEDRETQITFSMFGQYAPIEVKKDADKDQVIRKRIVAKVEKYLGETYDIKIGGATSIDVTMKGMNKGYGIKSISKELGFSLDEIGFVGDAIYPGGNDYPAVELGLEVVGVSNPTETFDHLLRWLTQ